MDKIIENNILIARFETTEPEVLEHDLGKAGTAECMQYHSDWNWLMPVVEKIETTRYHIPEKCRTRYDLKHDRYEGIINLFITYDERKRYGIGWVWGVYFSDGYHIGQDYNTKYKTKIGAVYAAVVTFIKWHNEHFRKE